VDVDHLTCSCGKQIHVLLTERSATIAEAAQLVASHRECLLKAMAASRD